MDTIVIIAGIGLLWAATMIYIYRDLGERNLPGWQQSLWVVVSLIPFAGFLAYLAGRLAARSAGAGRGPAGRGAALTPRMTLLQEPGRRLPTVPVSGARPAADRPAFSVRLAASEGAYRGQEFVVDEFPARIGRDSDCAVRLDQDLAVSRRHAELYVQDGRLWIRDLNSTHGTVVNNRPVGERELARGDKIRLGNSLLTVKIGR